MKYWVKYKDYYGNVVKLLPLPADEKLAKSVLNGAMDRAPDIEHWIEPVEMDCGSCEDKNRCEEGHVGMTYRQKICALLLAMLVSYGFGILSHMAM